MIGPKDVIKAATNLQSHLTSNVANVSQRAAIAALTGNLDAVHVMGEAFNRRRTLIVGLLNEIPGFECPMPQGAFYVYPSVKGVLGKTIRGKVANTSAELATIILDEVEVAAVQVRLLVLLATFDSHTRQAMMTLLKVSDVLKNYLQSNLKSNSDEVDFSLEGNSKLLKDALLSALR
jgi:aspartate/methionine/tyrosine aminotransferase